MKHRTLAAAALLACAMSAAHATDYYLVVPVQNRPASDAISVALNAQALPAGKVGVAYPGIDFQPLLQVSGDASFNGTGVRWSISQGGLPAGLTLDAASGRLAGTPTSVTAGQSFQVTAAYKTKAGSQTYTLAVANGDVRSCKDYRANNPGAPSGWYNLDVDGAGPAPSASYYCDMVSDGGGWTRVVRQTEALPVTNWNGGANGAAYALATVLIPQHTQVAFGKDESATAVDYVNGTYSAGNIASTLVTSPKTGFSYHMHRDVNAFYGEHDPEAGSTMGSPLWNNSLTFDRTGGRTYTWSFSPNNTNLTERGFAFAGVGLRSSSESFAWTVWVR
jgi:hypothetical protein